MVMPGGIGFQRSSADADPALIRATQVTTNAGVSGFLVTTDTLMLEGPEAPAKSLGNALVIRKVGT